MSGTSAIAPPVDILAKLAEGYEIAREAATALRRLADAVAFRWPIRASIFEDAADDIETAAGKLERRRRGVAALLRLEVLDDAALEALAEE